MEHKVEQELRFICESILKENKTLQEWSEIESDDLFQHGAYKGGFDATEEEFCFSVYLNDEEYWFQFSLNDVNGIVDGSISTIEIYDPL